MNDIWEEFHAAYFLDLGLDNVSLLVDVGKVADNLDSEYAYEVDLDEQILDCGRYFVGHLTNVAPDSVVVKFESKLSFDVVEFVAAVGIVAVAAVIVVVLNVVLLVEPFDGMLVVAAAPG